MIKSNIKKPGSEEISDPKLDDIEITQFIPVQILMIPTPRERKIKFIDFEESQSDEESSETQRRKRIEEKTVEKIVGFTLILANRDIGNKIKHMLGIEFPWGSIIYQSMESGNIENKKAEPSGSYYLSRSNNILVHFIGNKLNYFGLFDKDKCDICNIPLRKAYHCYDCQPKKRKHLTSFCKSCYIKREHAGHRSIALQYNDELFADFPSLAKL
jgi:hypothetical protein